MRLDSLTSRGDFLLKKYASVVQPIDVFTARYLGSKSREESDLVFDFVILLCFALRSNSVSISLKEIEGRRLIELLESMHPELRDLSNPVERDLLNSSAPDLFNKSESNETSIPEISVLKIDRLLKSGLFYVIDGSGEPGELTVVDAPLIIQGEWVYFRRQWASEWFIINAVKKRLNEQALVETSEISRRIHDLFNDESGRTSGQIAAAYAANQYPFSIITGGPGTGKTRTIVGYLAATLEMKPDLNVILCAPTGKAASRMVESIQNALKSDTRLSETGTMIPQVASTIHRLLGWNPSTGEFKHDEANPISADLIIVDEASMIDLVMFSRLLRATSSGCRIIMLGDKDQLASVEAGSVFGDLIRAGLSGVNSRLGSTITRLTYSWRFNSDSGLGSLAESINKGDFVQSWNVLSSNNEAITLISSNFVDSMLSTINTIHDDIVTFTVFADETVSRLEISQTVEKVFSRLNEYQVLTAHRTGPYGALYLNKFIDQQLSTTDWYAGRPVIATENDYDNGVFNGDLGITIQIAGEYWVYFGMDTSTGKERLFKPSQLGQVETAWVLTVHKSQGSEYKKILLVLPEYDSPVLSRELLYTAVTRARESVSITVQKSVWLHAVKTSLYQEGGFLNRLNIEN